MYYNLFMINIFIINIFIYNNSNIINALKSIIKNQKFL